MSRLLKIVEEHLERFCPIGVCIEMSWHENCTTVSFNVSDPKISFYWVEATCGDEWWYALPGVSGTSDPQILLDTISQRIERREAQGSFERTD
nr:hypothetical protein [Marseillevirus cajuinensis]